MPVTRRHHDHNFDLNQIKVHDARPNWTRADRSAAARHLKHRDEWIGWSEEQRRRRLRRSKQNRFHHQFSSELLSPCDIVMHQARLTQKPLSSDG